MALKAKHAAFVREYLVDGNAARAARAAGYSEKGAKVVGSKLLTFANVRKAVDDGLARKAKKTDITAQRVINRIAQVAFDEKGANGIIPPNKDILRACELLGKHFQLFTDVVVTNVKAEVTHVSKTEVKATLEEIESDC